MINIMNEQITLVLEDLELITDPYQRSMIRTQLISALSSINLTASFDVVANTLPSGKNAIKTDIPKDTAIDDTPIKFEEKDVNEQTEEISVEKESKKKTDSKKKEKEAEKASAPKEIDVDPNTPAKEESIEPIVVQVEDENGEIVELDITEAWNTIAPSMKEEGVEEESILELAQNLTAYNLMPIYATFSELKNNENKMMLSYYLQEVGLEDINGFISELSDGQFNDIYEFVNDDNLEYIVTSIAEAMSEE